MVLMAKAPLTLAGAHNPRYLSTNVRLPLVAEGCKCRFESCRPTNQKESKMRNSFEKELALIKDEAIRLWTIATLHNAPEYFWTGPASSSGKYHPACSNKLGGIITHTKRAVYFANRLCSGWGITLDKKDIVISAVILHDIAKTSSSGFSDYVNHPINAEKYFAANKGDVCTNFDLIKLCVNFHMGLWTPKEIKKPIEKYTLQELAVYTSDYLSTTKNLSTPVDNEEI